MENTVIGLFERTMNNCRYYEKENLNMHLLNEIGVLRGIAYVLELTGTCPHSEEFLYYIQKQQELKADEHEKHTQKIQEEQRKWKHDQ